MKSLSHLLIREMHKQNKIYLFASLAKGAGLRWRPLHFSAEAPTEPGGETVGATCCTRRDC